MSFADNQKLRQSLIAAYEDRPPLERGVLQLISIIYEGVSKTVLFGYIRRCEIPMFKGLSQTGLTQIINRLIKENLVVKGDCQQLRCHVLLVEEATAKRFGVTILRRWSRLFRKRGLFSTVNSSVIRS